MGNKVSTIKCKPPQNAITSPFTTNPKARRVLLKTSRMLSREHSTTLVSVLSQLSFHTALLTKNNNISFGRVYVSLANASI